MILVGPPFFRKIVTKTMSCEEEVMSIRKQLEKMTEGDGDGDHTQAVFPLREEPSKLKPVF
jgi:hypothetical protein